MEYTCIIVEDQILASELLIEYISNIPNIKLIGSAKNGSEAKQMISQLQPKILICKIELPDFNGLDLLNSLENPPQVILTSDSETHAIEGYDLNVSSYLLQPIDFSKLSKAMLKIIANFENSSKPVSKSDSHIFVKSESKLVKIEYNDILYIEGLREYIRIVTTKDKIITLQSLNKIEQILPRIQFYRIHRSHIINVNNIEFINGYNVHMQEHQLKISKGKKEQFIEHINFF